MLNSSSQVVVISLCLDCILSNFILLFNLYNFQVHIAVSNQVREKAKYLDGKLIKTRTLDFMRPL